jgi:Fic family protein
MADVIKAYWEPTPGPLLPKKARLACWYEAFVPDALAGRDFLFDGPTTAAVAAAEHALSAFDREGGGLADSEALARLLLRAESVASSKIEGLRIGGRRLLRAQLAASLGNHDTDVTAAEVLANIDAMGFAVTSAASDEPLTVESILGIHERLLSGTALEEHAGVLRTQQNWIGGSSFNPCSAAFVPPPHDRVADLLADLCDFCNDDHLPAVAQAAIAHAQFETIHPFIDGNGRTGRALIHVILRRRGLTTRVLAPISPVLATWSQDYVQGLGGTRRLGSPTSPEATAGLADWVDLFASAVARSVDDAQQYRDRTTAIQASWRQRLGGVRADSAAARLVSALPGAPIVTAQSAAALIDRSLQATNTAISRLVEADILKQTTAGRRNRAFEATELIDAFSDLERQLASPGGDTLASPPERPVPRRRG